jgi:FkbM family methyltransferase
VAGEQARENLLRHWKPSAQCGELARHARVDDGGKAEMADRILELLRCRAQTEVVDIGANPLEGGEPPYAPLLRRGLCRLTGFEPHPSALAKLDQQKGPHETYLPLAVGDGREHTLHVCKTPGMTSLLEPDADALRMWPMFPLWGEVIGRQTVSTVRVDDVVEIGAIDFLKIDVQGAELMVFQGGRTKLAHTVAVQAEVSFIPLYKNQPTYADIDGELRALGLVPHTFINMSKRLLKPLRARDPFQHINQVVEADVVYVRDFRRMDAMSEHQLTQLALVSHYAYASFDLAARCIRELEGRSAAEAGSTDGYIASL